MKEIQKIAEQRVLNNVLGDILFAEILPNLQGVSDDTIEFLENRIPILRSGKYELSASQALAGLESKPFTKSLTIEVKNVEDKLNPQDIYNIYPPKNSLDDYSDVLPHMVLNDSIFPWANQVSIDGKLQDTLPWVTLVLLNEEDIDIDKTILAGKEVVFPSAALFGTTQTKLTKENTAPFIKLTSAFKKLKDGITGRITDKDDLSKIDEKSLLICNRLPEKNKRYVVHLINLKNLVFSDENVTTTSIFNWSFQTKDKRVAFNGTVKKTTRQSFRLPDIQAIHPKNIIAQIKNISNTEMDDFKAKITAKTIENSIKDKLKTAKKNSLQVVFQEYLQIILKEIISQVYDQKENGKYLNDELIRSAFWLVIQDIITNDLATKTKNSSIVDIFKVFQTNASKKTKSIKSYLFRLKFRITLLMFLSNNKQKTDGILAKITADNIDNLKIENLDIPQSPNYEKLKVIFIQDKKYITKLYDDNKNLIQKKFENIKPAANTATQYQSITTKIGQFETAISYNDWITTIVDAIKLEATKPNRLKPIHSKPFEHICQNAFLRIIKHVNINNLTKAGFAPLPHFMRRGSKVVSMYRSPFTPVISDKKQTFKAIHYPDELYRFFGFAQMLDATYAAAWELGRMLTLENEHAANAIYKWKRQYIIENKAGLQIDPFGLVQSPKNILKEELFNNVIKPWLKDLMAFKNIPFAYLVPYEDMLPPNSIRFFNVDNSWLAALLDGVLSIGRIFDDEDKNPREVTWGKFSPIPNSEFGKGILIRSAVISDYPDVIITGNGEEPTMTRRLSSDIMLCLFDKSVQSVELFLKPMGMRFGLNDKIKTTIDIQNLIKEKPSHVVATELYKKSPKSIIKKK